MSPIPPREGARPRRINPATGIAVIEDWGPECARGFVSNARFASNATEQVIPRTNRATTRKWRNVQNPTK